MPIPRTAWPHPDRRDSSLPLRALRRDSLPQPCANQLLGRPESAWPSPENVAALGVGGVCAQVDRLLNRFVRLLEAVFAGRIVVVRDHRFRNSPVSHRQLRIEFRRLLKRARRLVMVERVNQAQSLIEKLPALSRLWLKPDDASRPGRSSWWPASRLPWHERRRS
jgi:hypothetical protein